MSRSAQRNGSASTGINGAASPPQPVGRGTVAEYLIAHIGHTSKWCEHVTWWKPDSKGYTICIDKAGRYSEDEARSICQWGSCIAVPVRSVEPLARSTPYFRAQGGMLQKLYDGGPHRPVDNEAQAWRQLLNARLLCSKTTEKPTPMPSSKARAIYLDAAHQATKEPSK